MRAASAFARARAAAILADDRLLCCDTLLAADSDRAPSEWTSSVFSWVSISYVLTIKREDAKCPVVILFVQQDLAVMSFYYSVLI